MKITLRTRHETARVLVVASELDLTDSITAGLQAARIATSCATTIAGGVEKLNGKKFDLVICDETIGGESGLKMIEILSRRSGATEVIFLTAPGNIEAGTAIEMGAIDTLTKPVCEALLMAKVRQVVEQVRMKEELGLLRQHVAMEFGYDNIVGESEAILAVRETTRRVAGTDIAILIKGENGTGKNQLAQVLHHHSTRRHKAFESLDCATTPSAIIESELFGPTQDGPIGIIQKANGGTVYLANIDSLSHDVQERLVHLFQYSEILPSGGDHPIKSDIRFICSTTIDPEDLVARGTLRKDLFNYVSTIILQLPSLRKRAEDIELLAEFFLRKTAHEIEANFIDLGREAREKLMHYRWPGNIRELENSLKRAAALCHNNRIESEDIIFLEQSTEVEENAPTLETSSNSKKELLADTQRAAIAKALEDNNWNFTQTAHTLGIGRTTLWRKVKKYNLKEEHSRQHETSTV